VSVLDFSEYLHSLTQHLFDSYSVDRSRITLEIDSDPVRLDVDRAIPCGLIVNELVSNSLRHAFPDGRSGIVRVKLQRVAPAGCTVVVGDDGVGMGRSASTGRTLGMRIVDSLAKQIDAEVRITTLGGTTFTMSFPRPSRAPRADSNPGAS
jgi:two-component sensor histidine kinase